MRLSSKLVRLCTAANFFFVLLSSAPLDLLAQFGYGPARFPLTSFSGITCISGMSLMANPSLCVFDSVDAVGIMSMPSPFAMAELGSHRAFVTWKAADDIGSASSIEVFGRSLFSETSIRSSLSYRYSEFSALGVALTYAHRYVQSFPSSYGLQCDAAVTLVPDKNSRVVAILHNVFRSSPSASASVSSSSSSTLSSSSARTLLQDLCIGYGVRTSEEFSVDILYRIVLQRSRSFQISCCLRPYSSVALRLCGDPDARTLLAELAGDVDAKLRVISTIQVHAVLGHSIGGGLRWSW